MKLKTQDYPNYVHEADSVEQATSVTITELNDLTRQAINAAQVSGGTQPSRVAEALEAAMTPRQLAVSLSLRMIKDKREESDGMPQELKMALLMAMLKGGLPGTDTSGEKGGLF